MMRSKELDEARRSAERYRSVIVLADAQTARLFGYNRQELIDQPIETLVPVRLRQRHLLHRSGYASDPRVRAMGANLERYGFDVYIAKPIAPETFVQQIEAVARAAGCGVRG